MHGRGIKRTEAAAITVELVLHVFDVAAEHAVAVVPFLNALNFEKGFLVKVADGPVQTFDFARHADRLFVVAVAAGRLQTVVIVVFYSFPAGFRGSFLRRLRVKRKQCEHCDQT